MNECLALFRGMYPYFAIPALFVIIYRIRHKYWTRSETILLGLILLHTLLLLLQVFIADHKWYVPRRYLLPAAALGFGWTAWGFARLYRLLPQWWQRRIVPVIAIGLGIFLLYDGMVPGLKARFGHRKAARRAIETVAVEAIRQEWPDLPPAVKNRHPHHYISKRRPVIASSFDALGAMAGGRDYLPHVAGDGGRVDGWFIAATTPVPRAAEVIRQVEAGGKIWVLCRRKNPSR